jgi:hypothetical protein
MYGGLIVPDQGADLGVLFWLGRVLDCLRAWHRAGVGSGAGRVAAVRPAASMW